MNSSVRRFAVAAAVYIGALCLFGPLTFVLVVGTAETVAGIVGIGTLLTGLLNTVVIVGAIAIALEVASEIAAVQLHGSDALRRGSPRRQLGRNLLLAAVAFVASISLVEFAISTFQWGIARGEVVIAGVSFVLLVGLAGIFVRAVGSFRRGQQHTE